MQISLIKRNYRVSSKSSLTIPTELDEILIGLMLGDLYAEKLKQNSNTRLQFKQSSVNKEYIDHLWSLFSIYCGTESKLVVSKDTRPNRQVTHLSFELIVYLVLIN